MAKLVAQAQWSLDSYSIGLKLRSLRTQKRLTLARLAAETGLSTALLSKLETDRMVPTLPTLATISRVYGVGMSYFFKEATRHTVSITRKAQLQGHERGPEQVRITPLNAPNAGMDNRNRRRAEGHSERRRRGTGANRGQSAGGATYRVRAGRRSIDSGFDSQVVRAALCARWTAATGFGWDARVSGNRGLRFCGHGHDDGLERGR